MSHRKFEKPRSGNLGFLPRKRCTRGRGRIKSFPKEKKADKPHLTAFLGYKVGSTHITRDLDRQGSKLHQKEVTQQVSFIETPPMVVVGIVGYKESLTGLKAHTSIFIQKLDKSFKRNLVKRWHKAKRTMYSKHENDSEYETKTNEKFKSIAETCHIIRVVAHTQPMLIKKLQRRKAQIIEIQVNGGSTAEKIAFARGLLEQKVSISSVFKKDELIDFIGITKGKGFKGVVSRWGVTRLPRKTHKGLRKVACIGSWHPARVSYTVARAGQKGYHHRVQFNNKILMVGKDMTTKEGKLSGQTEYDLTEKSVNPMGGFVNYGFIQHEFLMVKGAIMGAKKKVVTLRKAQRNPMNRSAREKTKLKFIDTSSKMGTGRFQTSAEKRAFMGPLKKELEKKREEDLKKLAEERQKKEVEAAKRKAKREAVVAESKEGKDKKKKRKKKKKKKRAKKEKKVEEKK